MTDTLYGDLETFSEVPIKNGVYRYAEAAEIMLFSYAMNDDRVKVWDCTQEELPPAELLTALHDPDVECYFQNSMFDRTVLRLQAPDLCPPIPRWRDTMVQALAHSLPGGLEKLCVILNVPADLKKMEVGKNLIRLFCMPRPKNQTLRRATRETHPVEWRQFVDYAGHDIEAMRYIRKKLPRWNYAGRELALWHLDQRINDRGVAMDVDLARASLKTVEREKARLARRTSELTAGQVGSTTQRDQLLRYLLASHGVDLPDMKGDTLERRINDPELPDAVRELMANRLQASSTSPAKYKALLGAVSADGRLRGTTQFCGANRTGRWAGRIFQPHNLMRVPKHIKPVYDEVIEGIKADSIDFLYENAIEAVASVVRGSIVAPEGKTFAISDLSNIEGRKLAWLAGEDWKLKAFREYDAGTGHDLYALTYARAFGIKPEEVMADDKAGGIKRQVGKVQELALGYQGGVGAFVSMAANYGVNLDDMADKAISAIPVNVMVKAEEAWERAIQQDNTFGLNGHVYMVCHSLTTMWRNANPNIKQFWWTLQDAVKDAINTPGNDIACGRLTARRDGAWLRIRLPSGRFLCYPDPRVSEEGKISYMGVNQYTRRWQRIYTYGGKLAENVTQAASRDVLADAMPRIEDAGYEIVLHVHDEVVTEIPEDATEETIQGLGVILRTNPNWADGLPLWASSFAAKRYRKE